ncbi:MULTISPECIES: diaminopimelate decarboxylase [Anaerotruncus]|uniref:Diaminopimelate decarboxylase n=1 Tax=Anaerotruncus colihominis TaxID=169435 RepID=A0A845RJ07_9FIRM|nr:MULTISPECIES: diaminopimelate decarboxylase [Anaerotruncus]MCI8492563.1 diaminopimelate decarboxylase [Anaerotruncus sp.]MCR2024549.1 diaminopimelate decarboxylase [Anaerotruncus colihominis]NBI79553.1 diaminopimelate decarboxylase [Anaerotruncus colihominis]NDO39909.1 diaminopimelate decarboxylase [Anaerotruncus colihominis]
MFVSDCLGLNKLGHLTIGGCDTVALAQTYGTPLYVMDEDEIRRACASYRSSIERYYDGRGLVTYASKAFCCKAACKIAAEEGLGLDVVSGGELYTAISAGFPAERIFFHGNNKTVQELTEALAYGVGQIVVDNFDELETLNQLALSRGEPANILFRIKPGIDAHTHDFVRTGQIDSKFGLALETGEAMQAVRAAVSMQGVRLRGVHCHIGSQIFDIEPFEHAAEVMLGFIADVRDQTGCELEILDLGGGFGIKYLPEHDPVEYDRYMQRVARTVRRVSQARGIKTPFIVIEPGRSIAGPAGVTLYTAGAVKEIPGVRTYVSIDGGMCDNPRYILYRSEYEAMVANKASQPKTRTVTLAGKCCESGDLIGEGMQIQEIHPGDIIAVLATGAYNYSMSSNYNRIPRPPVVMLRGGQARVVVKRETYEDLVRNDLE